MLCETVLNMLNFEKKISSFYFKKKTRLTPLGDLVGY